MNSGLTEKEAEVYIFLAKHGASKTRKIARLMKKDKAQIFRILKRLQTKGVVESTLEFPARYNVVPFEKVLDSVVKAKQEEVAFIENAKKDLIEYLRKNRQAESAIEKFVVIKGNKKIHSKIAKIIHVTGKLDWQEVAVARESLPNDVRDRYQIYAYLHDEMGAALAAADLIVSRAGASILGEFTYYGVPAILVPYPYAWRYQRVNANWLSERGAAVIVEDADLAEQLVPLVTDLFNDEERLNKMANASRKYAQPEAAQRIASLLLSLGQGGQFGTT